MQATAHDVASVSTTVRGTTLRLVAYTRALELCARMNRETEVLDFIDAIPPGAVLYDLGACEGRFALYAALRGVEVYAFEPEALNFRALTENVAINGEQPARLLHPVNHAIGATTHTAALRIAQPWAGGHQKVLAGAGRTDLDFDFTAEQTVEVVALDEYIDARGLPPPDYLKVDIDGSERAFLQGAAATLRQPALKAIMFELHTGDEHYPGIVQTLAACGLVEKSRSEVGPDLFNIWFQRQNGLAAAARPT